MTANEELQGVGAPQMNFLLCVTFSDPRVVFGAPMGSLSCSAKCPLHANRSIGSVRGLHRPQTNIDAPSVVNLSAPMCLQPSHERFFLSLVSLLTTIHAATNQRSRNWADQSLWAISFSRGVLCLIWCIVMSSVETVAAGFYY